MEGKISNITENTELSGLNAENDGANTVITGNNGADAATDETKPKYKRPRDINLSFRVSAEERDMINRRAAQSGMTNLRAYMVKMAIDGRVIRVEFESVREMVRLLTNATSNINQIAHRVNQTGNLYAADVADLQARYEELWGQAKEILRKFADL